MLTNLSELSKVMFSTAAAANESCQSHRRQFTVSIEGNIGAGKSTMLNYFSTANESSSIVEPVPEPLEKWCNVSGVNLLQKLYEDPQRWFFSFNLYCMLTRLQMHRHTTDRPVKMLERSLHSARHCFMENAAVQGQLHSAELGVLDSYYRRLLKGPWAMALQVDLYVYLRCPPSVCHERVTKRNRSEEAPLPLSLLESLHQLHESWLLGADSAARLNAPVLVLDASQNLDAMQQLWDQHRCQILFGSADQ